MVAKSVTHQTPNADFPCRVQQVAKKHLAEEAALLSVSTQGQLCECTVPAHALAAEHVLTATRLAAVKSPLISWWSLTTFSKWAAFIAATSCTGTTELFP